MSCLFCWTQARPLVRSLDPLSRYAWHFPCEYTSRNNARACHPTADETTLETDASSQRLMQLTHMLVILILVDCGRDAFSFRRARSAPSTHLFFSPVRCLNRLQAPDVLLQESNIQRYSLWPKLSVFGLVGLGSYRGVITGPNPHILLSDRGRIRSLVSEYMVHSTHVPYMGVSELCTPDTAPQPRRNE